MSNQTQQTAETTPKFVPLYPVDEVKAIPHLAQIIASAGDPHGVLPGLYDQLSAAWLVLAKEGLVESDRTNLYVSKTLDYSSIEVTLRYAAEKQAKTL